MTIKLITSEKLRAVLHQQFPIDTNYWCRATDEVQDMSKYARELSGLGEEHACDFGACASPSAWNTRGIESIIRFYTKLSDQDKQAFLDMFEEWFEEWLED